MRWLALFAMLLLVFGCSPDNPTDDSSELQGVTDGKGAPAPTDDALMLPGDGGDGSVIMVNGRAIRPAGELISVRSFPTKMVVLAGGEVVVSGLRGHGISVIDGATFTELADVNFSKIFHGLAANAAGDKIWVSGGDAQKVYEMDVVAGVPSTVREFNVPGYPIGVAINEAETRLLVTSSYGSAVYIFNLDTGALLQTAPAGVYPFEIQVKGNEAYVSNWGGSSVTVINILTGARLAEIAVGTHPEGMVLSPDGQTLYVADSDSDTISVVDLSSREVIDAYDVFAADEMVGASPVDIAVSANGQRLYVAAAGINAIVVLDATDGDVLGMIPTGYYPSAVALDENLGVVYAANAKGGQAIPDKSGVNTAGTMQQIDLPNTTELADYTQTVMDNLTRTELFWETMDFESPIPTERGTPSTQIKRVVFIMKENKTFDQVFSDLPGVNGDQTHLVYGAEYTPNAHALAQMFTNCDNYFSEADASIQGHMWATMMYSNDYVEKSKFAPGREVLSGVEPAAIGGKGTIFHQLMESGVNFRVYGQVVGAVGEVADLAPYIDFKYGFFNLGNSDELKAAEVIRELEGGIWPEFIYISLPNNHGAGTDAGQPTMPFYVGDNDAGLGMLVDYISHSEYWHETAIFVTEDDPQSGSDHVDPHRTLSMVISPWAKHGYISSVLYSMPSIWMTIELILGLPPLTVYDEYTSPMYDCFTMEPDNSTYDALPNPTPLEFNPSGLAMAEYSRKQNWAVPDQVKRLGEIVWAVMRPGEEFPYQNSVDAYSADMDDEDEEEEAEEYLEVAEALKAYALQHGLWDGSTLPTIKEMANH